MQRQFAAAIEQEGGRAHRLPSGAGHDGMALIAIAPIGMLFVRCTGGISHNPAEAVTLADVAAGARVPRAVHRVVHAAAQSPWVLLDHRSPAVDPRVRCLRTAGDAERFLADLVRMPSDNPPGDCAPHAKKAAALLEALGFIVERHVVPDPGGQGQWHGQLHEPHSAFCASVLVMDR
jgi:acetylornithine deacetylase/succinyl-diaminopimelate desuccinylase-like protein